MTQFKWQRENVTVYNLAQYSTTFHLVAFYIRTCILNNSGNESFYCFIKCNILRSGE